MVSCTLVALYWWHLYIPTLGRLNGLLREREDRWARSEALSEVAQFRRDFRIFYLERHRCDLELKTGYWNSNGYHLNTIDQLASSQQNQISDIVCA